MTEDSSPLSLRERILLQTMLTADIGDIAKIIEESQSLDEPERKELMQILEIACQYRLELLDTMRNLVKYGEKKK